MAIERKTHLYEILVRFDSEGKYRGSHAIDIERITDDEEVIRETELPARPVERKEIGNLFGAKVSALVEQIETERAAASEATAAAAAERDARDSAETEAGRLREMLATVRAAVGPLE